MARRAKPWYRKQRDQWCAWIGGRQVTLAEGNANKRQAEARFHELMLERAARPGLDSPRQTVASVIEAYFDDASRRLSPRHLANQKDVLQRFAQDFGEREVTTVKPIHLTQWLGANTQWKSDWTLYRVVATVKRPFEWAVQQELIARNPFKTLSHRTGKPRRPVSADEFQAMLRGAGGSRGKTFRQVLIFQRFTGCRPGEMAALKWSDINLDRRVIVMQDHKTLGQMNRPAPRVVPLVAPVLKLLIHRRRQTKSAHVFLNARGNPWHRSALALRIKRCRDRQGIPAGATLYGIRHEFGTQAIIRGVDLKTLAQLMGHTTTRMTEYYLHLAGETAHLETSMRQATSPRRDA